MACEIDYECPGQGEVCYKGVSWSDKNESFCACDTEMGWEGEDCSGLGPQTIYWIATSAFFVVFSSLLLLRFGPRGFRYVYKVRRSPSLATLGQTFVANVLFLIFNIVHHGVKIADVTDVEGFGAEREGAYFEKEKRGSQAIPVIVSAMLLILFVFHANLNVGLVWADIAYRSNNFIFERYTRETRLFWRLIRGLQIVFTLTLIILMIVARDMVYVFAFFYVLMLVVIYTVARRWFQKVQSSYVKNSKVESSERESRMKKPFALVNKCSILLTLSYLGIIGTFIPMTVIALQAPDDIYPSADRDYPKPGTVNPFLIWFQLMNLFITLTSLVIFGYLDVIIKSNMESSVMNDNEIDTHLSKSKDLIVTEDNL